MTFASNFKKGIDVPPIHWLQQLPVSADPGISTAYDGNRFLFIAIQSSQTASGTAGTSQIYQYDTWSNGIGLLATLTSGSAGMNLEYDPNRNILIVTNGAGLTSWQVFNLNITSVTVAGVACAARALTTMTPVLPAVANTGTSICLPSWGDIGSLNFSNPQTGFTADSGGTTTNVIASANIFTPMMVGMQIQFTSGTNSGKVALITAVASATSVTVSPAITAGATAGDTFEIQLPVGTSSGSNSSSTLNDTTQAWPTNQYKNSDIVITSGTGSGQRRRIASNTGTAITLAAAVTGNANTGNWSITPDNTSVYQIQPSGDFLYYASANATSTVWSLDLSSTAPPSWVATTNNTPATITGGSNLLWPGPSGAFYITTLRGGATATLYNMSLGPQVWTTPTVFFGPETFTTGSSCEMLYNHSKLFIQKEGQQRCYTLDLTTGVLQAAVSIPYAVPSTNDGQRISYVKTATGVDWVYNLRPGGQQLFRIPLEWGD